MPQHRGLWHSGALSGALPSTNPPLRMGHNAQVHTQQAVTPGSCTPSPNSRPSGTCGYMQRGQGHPTLPSIPWTAWSSPSKAADPAANLSPVSQAPDPILLCRVVTSTHHLTGRPLIAFGVIPTDPLAQHISCPSKPFPTLNPSSPTKMSGSDGARGSLESPRAAGLSQGGRAHTVPGLMPVLLVPGAGASAALWAGDGAAQCSSSTMASKPGTAHHVPCQA